LKKNVDFSKMDQNQRKKAYNEITILQKLSHPFIIKYRESFLDGSFLKKTFIFNLFSLNKVRIFASLWIMLPKEISTV